MPEREGTSSTRSEILSILFFIAAKHRYTYIISKRRQGKAEYLVFIIIAERWYDAEFLQTEFFAADILLITVIYE